MSGNIERALFANGVLLTRAMMDFSYVSEEVPAVGDSIYVTASGTGTWRIYQIETGDPKCWISELSSPDTVTFDDNRNLGSWGPVYDVYNYVKIDEEEQDIGDGETLTVPVFAASDKIVFLGRVGVFSYENKWYVSPGVQGCQPAISYSATAYTARVKSKSGSGSSTTFTLYFLPADNDEGEIEGVTPDSYADGDIGELSHYAVEFSDAVIADFAATYHALQIAALAPRDAGNAGAVLEVEEVEYEVAPGSDSKKFVVTSAGVEESFSAQIETYTYTTGHDYHATGDARIPSSMYPGLSSDYTLAGEEIYYPAGSGSAGSSSAFETLLANNPSFVLAGSINVIDDEGSKALKLTSMEFSAASGHNADDWQSRVCYVSQAAESDLEQVSVDSDANETTVDLTLPADTGGYAYSCAIETMYMIPDCENIEMYVKEKYDTTYGVYYPYIVIKSISPSWSVELSTTATPGNPSTDTTFDRWNIYGVSGFQYDGKIVILANLQYRKHSGLDALYGTEQWYWVLDATDGSTVKSATKLLSYEYEDTGFFDEGRVG